MPVPVGASKGPRDAYNALSERVSRCEGVSVIHLCVRVLWASESVQTSPAGARAPLSGWVGEGLSARGAGRGVQGGGGGRGRCVVGGATGLDGTCHLPLGLKLSHDLPSWEGGHMAACLPPSMSKWHSHQRASWHAHRSLDLPTVKSGRSQGGTEGPSAPPRRWRPALVPPHRYFVLAFACLSAFLADARQSLLVQLHTSARQASASSRCRGMREPHQSASVLQPVDAIDGPGLSCLDSGFDL